MRPADMTRFEAGGRGEGDRFDNKQALCSTLRRKKLELDHGSRVFYLLPSEFGVLSL